MGLAEMKKIYGEYIAQVKKLESEKKIGVGLFGMGKKISDDPCHEAFADRLKEELKSFGDMAPSSAEVREVLGYIYHAQAEMNESLSTYWMMNAVHGLTLDLIRKLDPDDAQSLIQLYNDDVPKRRRFPVQKQVFSVLKKAAQK
ncbi:hypothetical protein [Ruminococcus flavefaciens]|uniref:hypothetical protein n=1 Tax=Ruminococcus flavefaciens TaxID=1265 RepID=UPI00048B7501|nr:hypothetical protein [Ruminococcus flavefaciens]